MLITPVSNSVSITQINHGSIKLILKNVLLISSDMCGKTFDKKYYLLEHMNAIHLNRREYICTICGEYLESRPVVINPF